METYDEETTESRENPPASGYIILAVIALFIFGTGFFFGIIFGQDHPKPGTVLTGEAARRLEEVEIIQEQLDFYRELALDAEKRTLSSSVKFYMGIEAPLGETTRIPGTDLVIEAWMPKGRAELYRLRAQVKKINPLAKRVGSMPDPFPFKPVELGNNFWDDDADCPERIIDDRYILHVDGLERYNDGFGNEELVAEITMIDLGKTINFDYIYPDSWD